MHKLRQNVHLQIHHLPSRTWICPFTNLVHLAHFFFFFTHCACSTPPGWKTRRLTVFPVGDALMFSPGGKTPFNHIFPASSLSFSCHKHLRSQRALLRATFIHRHHSCCQFRFKVSLLLCRFSTFVRTRRHSKC